MKEFSNKTPYLAPQLTVVEFRMEVGYSESDLPEVSIGVGGIEEMGRMYFAGQQNEHSGSYMGSQMGYYGSGYFTPDAGGTVDGNSYF